MNHDATTWLQSWLRSQVNGDWEHRYGVKIASLDNPGWSVVIDIAETSLKSKPFEALQHDRGESDWITCRVNGEQFEGFGDLGKLARILDIFRAWATS